MDSAIQARADSNNEPLVLKSDAELIDSITIASGHAALAAGTVLGEVGSGATYTPVTIASGATGENFPKLILAEGIDASSGQTTVSAYNMGLFADSKLAFGAGVDLDTRITLSTDDKLTVSMRDAMRMMGLRVASVISATAVETT